MQDQPTNVAASSPLRNELHIALLAEVGGNLVLLRAMCRGLSPLWPGVAIYTFDYMALSILLCTVFVPISIYYTARCRKEKKHLYLGISTMVISVIPVPIYLFVQHYYMTMLGLQFQP